MAIAIENQTALLAAILEKVSQPPPAPPKEKSTLDIVGELSAFKDLFSSKQPSPLALMKDAMELKELIMGDSAGADDDPLTMAFKHLVPEIMDGVKAMREAEEERSKRSIRTAPAREPRRRPDVDAELSPQDRAHAEDAVDMERDAETQTRLAFDFFAQKFLTPVLVLAGKDEDPQTVGYYLARLIGRDPAALDIVGQVLSEDNFIERLAQYNAEILQHADWIDLTTAWLAHALWPDANDAPEPESATNSATIDEKEDFQGIKAGPADSGPGGDQGLDQGNGEPSNDADSSASGPGPANDP